MDDIAEGAHQLEAHLNYSQAEESMFYSTQYSPEKELQQRKQQFEAMFSKGKNQNESNPNLDDKTMNSERGNDDTTTQH